MASGSKMAPKASIIIHYTELGKPYAFPGFFFQGIDPARGRKGAEGKGMR